MVRDRIEIQGEVILIDETLYEFVLTLGLSIVRRGGLKHVIINTQPYYKQYLHRVLLNITEPHKIVDHIDGNGLNNRKENLRVTCKVGNALNMRRNVNKKSGLPKGVYKERDGYKACIQVNGLNKYLGHFTSIDSAEARYKAEAEKFWAQLQS